MSEERTYLELSEGGSHKFYEVVVIGCNVTIRYGRIGDAGTAKTTAFPTPEKAKAEAQKKLLEKTKKGYAAAVQGARKKRTVTRRDIFLEDSPPVQSVSNAQPAHPRAQAAPSPAQAPQASAQPSRSGEAPILWKFDTGHRAFGIFVDKDLIWIGNEEGSIYALDHHGKVRMQHRLPDGVKCIVADSPWLYAGCDDGNVYDLSGKIPYVAYKISDDIDIFWLDIRDGILGVSDAVGSVTIINHEDESQWKAQSKGRSGWMLRCDEIGVYHGHTAGVSMYDWDSGKQLWHQSVDGSVLFGWQEEATLYVATSARKVYRISKRGDIQRTYDTLGGVLSCASTQDGKHLFAADTTQSIYCFAHSGERLWKLATGCGSAFSMQYADGKLYFVTHLGTLACMDASEEAIENAIKGKLPAMQSIAAPKAIEVQKPQLETVNQGQKGVVVECYVEGGKPRMRVLSDGFEKSWNVQFPKEIREVGARYLVDEVRTSARGGFYRAFGSIKKIVS